MKKILIIILIFTLLLVTLVLIRRFDFNNSIFVITQNTNTNEIHYYEVNNWKYKRNINEFESDKIEVFKVDNECYNNHADIENHIALNQLIIEKCTIKDYLENNIEINGYIEKIIKLVSKKEKHDIIGNTIIILSVFINILLHGFNKVFIYIFIFIILISKYIFYTINFFPVFH